MDIITVKKKNKVEVYIRNISLTTLFCLFIITHSSQLNINIRTGLLIHKYCPPVHVLANLAVHRTHQLVPQVLVP